MWHASFHNPFRRRRLQSQGGKLGDPPVEMMALTRLFLRVSHLENVPENDNEFRMRKAEAYWMPRSQALENERRNRNKTGPKT